MYTNKDLKISLYTRPKSFFGRTDECTGFYMIGTFVVKESKASELSD